MTDSNTVIAEKMLTNIKTEDSADLDKNISSSADPVTWRAVLRYEFKLGDLMDGILDSDIVIPKLVICEIQTISAFHYAALRGADAILTLFIERLQMPADICLSNGSTALQFACFAGMLETVKMLLDKFKADLNRRDNYGWTPLHYASIGGQLAVVEYLVARGADISARDKDGTTAAYRAQVFDHVEIVSYFLQSSGDDDLLLVDQSGGLDDNQNQPGDEKNEILYMDIKTAKAALAAGKNPPPGGITAEEYEAAKLMKENDYELPEKLITRIECKYIPGSGEKKEGQRAGLGGGKLDSTESKRENSKAKIRKIVENQLKDVFTEDPYLRPCDGASTEESANIFGGGDGGIGFNTLKQVLRDEFLKYRAESMKEGGGGHGKKDVDDNSTEIYEEISKVEAEALKVDKNRWVVGGRTMRGIRSLSRNAPPLPPRNSVVMEDVFRQSEQVRLDVEFSKAGVMLERIEESQAVLEACFRSLVAKLNVGDWQKLAQALPLRDKPSGVKSRIKAIEMNNPANPKKQAEAALKEWRLHFGQRADIKALTTALKKCGLTDKVEIVEAAGQEFVA